jgi:hypothetical protein
MTGQVALEKLIQGNGRFVAGNGAGAEGVDLAGAVYSLKTGSVTILAEDGY